MSRDDAQDVERWPAAKRPPLVPERHRLAPLPFSRAVRWLPDAGSQTEETDYREVIEAVLAGEAESPFGDYEHPETGDE